MAEPLPIDIGPIISARLRAWAHEGLDELRAATPVDTGHMQRSWQAEIGPTEALISNPVSYARYVILGTPKHTIRGHPWLSFIVEGHKVVTKNPVQHPGTKGNEQVQQVLERLLVQAAEMAQEV